MNAEDAAEALTHGIAVHLAVVDRVLGPCTGDVSAPQLRDFGATLVEIGVRHLLRPAVGHRWTTAAP